MVVITSVHTTHSALPIAHRVDSVLLSPACVSVATEMGWPAAAAERAACTSHTMATSRSATARAAEAVMAPQTMPRRYTCTCPVR